MSDEAYPDALPAGHHLHWYVLDRVLGQGGFGITYLAHDTNLDRRVAIKEYLPADYARRDADTTVRARTESQAERFAWGLERFSLEARTLARFDHPNIVRVYSVFEANNTAYMVMRFEDGENLATLLERSGTMPERQLLDCLLAILDGLQLVHEAGFIHRDIKPENIYIRRDGTPVLLDFGSARQALGRSRTMTILVAPGYAPLEQYYGDSAAQGPWTDIYSLAATCYRAITGRPPPDAVVRAKGVLGSAREVLQPAVEAGRGRYSERLLRAVDHALHLSEVDRPPYIAAWREELQGQPAPVPAPASPRPLVPTTSPAPPAGAPPRLGPAALAPAQTSAVTAVSPDAPARASLAARAGLHPAVIPVVTTAALLAAGMWWYVRTHDNATATPATAAQEKPSTAAAAPAAVWHAPAVVPAAASIMSPVATTSATAPRQPPRALVDDRRAPANANANANANAMATVTAPRPGPGPASVITAPINIPPVAAAAPAVQGQAGSVSPDLAVAANARSAGVVSATAPAAEPASYGEARPKATTIADAAPRATAAPPGSAGTAAAPTMTALTVRSTQAQPDGGAARPLRDERRDDRRDERLDAAEAALRRGDHAAAVELLAPLAGAGVSRAQLLLGRANEEAGRQPNYFEAYIWYSIAARNGEAAASTPRERAAGKLQPAEVHQADQVVARWKARATAAGMTGR